MASVAFEQAKGVVSLYEPDVFTQLVRMRDFSGANDKLISKLTAACIRLTCKKTIQDQVVFWVVKFRSFVIELADLICQHFPGAKCIFLYRNTEPWLDSFIRAFGGYLSPEQIRETWFLGKQVIRTINAHPISDPGEITAGLSMGLMWLNNMACCHEIIEAGHPILPVCYEDMKTDPLSTMKKLFEYCGVKVKNETALVDVLTKDSQAGSGIAREKISQKKWDFDAELLDDLRQVIAEHPVINTVDYVLPGTLTL
jgi:hypothetical protein